ncbi:hypothetical protein Dsin_006901 [Dipteronia sinensis]|uniref:Uncharacterized protein n=1 Tax=Dipteronia sinensis TaxID=43782 RepID=A0AAE0B0L5_9ROSI|nr:hypothetical protein Dsin_006901 [Dipteronia sinensis]
MKNVFLGRAGKRLKESDIVRDSAIFQASLRKYAARSPPAFVANSTYTVTSFTLVLEFKKGRLQNLYWKRDGCAKCSGSSIFVCLNNQDCAIRTSSCKNRGGSVDCSLGIQLAFSGTDKHLSALVIVLIVNIFVKTG